MTDRTTLYKKLCYQSPAAVVVVYRLVWQEAFVGRKGALREERCFLYQIPITFLYVSNLWNAK